MTPQDNTTQAMPPAAKTYQNLFHPQTIAVIGASNDPLKPGGRVIKNIRDNGYKGRLWAVNPKSHAILALPTFASIAALPEAPDLAIVAIPSALVLSAVNELAQRKAGAVIVLTAGFGEKDEAGKRAEQEMRAIADSSGMTLIGPNCSGFLTHTYKGKFAGIIPKQTGAPVDFISGSGATVDYVMERGSSLGLSFGTVINLGNSVQMGVEDLLEIYDENYGPNSARILMLYMESIAKPDKLLRHAQSLSRKGCALVGIKSGATEAGERAAASHTGAIATSDTAVAALFEKAGIIRVQGRGALINVACVLTAAKGAMKGKRVCVITDAGGPGVMLSDELARNGLDQPRLTERTREALSKILPKESSTLNPIDVLPSRTAQQIKEVLKVLEMHESNEIDVIAILMGDSGMSDNSEIYREISNAMGTSVIPIIPVLSSVTSCRDKIADFIARGNIYFADEVELGQALGKVLHRTAPEEIPPPPAGYNRHAVEAALNEHEGVLTPETVTRVLGAAGFRLVPQTEIFHKDQLVPCCEALGYPLAMKVIGPLHKTDVGGVKLGIADETAALSAWNTLMRIPDAIGVLIQPMVSGLEVILGASREDRFGHLVMFGLGGIHTEILKDVSFRIAPIAGGESLSMIEGLRSHALLEGVRGEPGMAIPVLSDCIQRLGRLVGDFPQIKEIDLNPIKGVGDDLYVVDARIIVQR